jgi:hypothetical protein
MNMNTQPQDFSDVLTVADLEAAGIALDQIPSALDELERYGLLKVTVSDGFIKIKLTDPRTGGPLIFPPPDGNDHV